MAKQVIWSKNAEDDLIKILEYWNEHTGNNVYSKKLYDLFQEIIFYISHFPEIGRRLEDKSIRFVVVSNFTIYYSFINECIEILYIWDNRRNPEDLKIE